MKISADNFATSLAAARVAVAAIPDGLGTVKGLDDHGLLEIQRGLSDLRRLIDARSSLLAGEVACRSHRNRGYAGLAQREGFQSPEKLVQSATGSTTREASTLVTAGTMVHEAMIDEAVDPATGEVREGFWTIVRPGSLYWLIPPPEIDPGQAPTPCTRSRPPCTTSAENDDRRRPSGEAASRRAGSRRRSSFHA